jgi:hypothetical protein
MLPRKLRLPLLTLLLLATLLLGMGMGMAQPTHVWQDKPASYQLADGPGVVVGHH